MPRQARIDAPGALHHLIVRGIERKRIFRDDRDRDDFLNRLGNIFLETATPCYGWALLPNHVHLLMRTGRVPIATVMRRLLTGYAVTYNLRHGRHGPLFQNRYKSILCEEDLYLLELVRYIHLNPLRAKLVEGLAGLEGYRYCGHGAVLGKREIAWQDVDSVLGYFGRVRGLARKQYREYVTQGKEMGQRPDLIGGGLIRSLGGWARVKELRRGGERLKADERILGRGPFVEEALKISGEEYERRERLKACGYDLDRLAQKVGESLGIAPQQIWIRGKYEGAVEGRSLFCYWAVRELGVKTTELARRFGLTQAAVSISVKRGERIAREKGLNVFLP